MICPMCDHVNSDSARFCDACGATLLRTEPAPGAAATGPTVHLDEAAPAAGGPEPGPASPAVPSARPWRELSGGLWLIGLGVLFLSGTFWPGILVLVGLSAYLEQRARGQQQYALRSLLFAVGLALLFWTNWLWPGILLLLGVLAIISPELRPRAAGTSP